MAQPLSTRSPHASPARLVRLLRALSVAGFAASLPFCVHTAAAQSATHGQPYELAAAAASPIAATPDPTLTDSLHLLTASFQPGPNEEYTLDDGDQIHLDVSGRAELTGDYTLGPDGRITLPSVGSVLLSGMTRDQAADAVQKAMLPFYADPSVTVGVVHYLSNHILLLGAVQRPGLLNFDQPPTLPQVLSRGGIGSDNAQMNDSGNVAAQYGTSTAGGYVVPDRAFIYRGSQELAIVDLKRLLSGGAFADLRLRRNDIVLIPVENQLISVLGAVKTPGAIRYNPESTLQVMLSQAGGLAEQAGSNPLIQVVNPSTGTNTQVRFQQLLDPHRGNGISLHPGDVIFVPSSGFAKFAYVVDKMNPILTVIAFTTLAARQ
jgi:polysaccharide export outer membrane protein